MTLPLKPTSSSSKRTEGHRFQKLFFDTAYQHLLPAQNQPSSCRQLLGDRQVKPTRKAQHQQLCDSNHLMKYPGGTTKMSLKHRVGVILGCCCKAFKSFLTSLRPRVTCSFQSGRTFGLGPYQPWDASDTIKSSGTRQCTVHISRALPSSLVLQEVFAQGPAPFAAHIAEWKPFQDANGYEYMAAGFVGTEGAKLAVP